MRHFSRRLLSLAGLVAYATFASGLTGALHETLAHAGASSFLSFAGGTHASTHEHGHNHQPHDKSHNSDCPTCYQLASATNAALSLSTVLPQFGDQGRPSIPGRFDLAPAAQVLTCIAPRAPPLA